MVDETETGGASVNVATPEVTLAEPTDHGRKDETAGDNKSAVPTVLPPHDLALTEVADVRDTGPATRLDEHPTDVRVKEALVRIVRVQGRVSVAVVCAVAARPPLDRTFDRTGTSNRERVLEGLRGIIRAVGPEAMIACGNACATCNARLAM